VQRPQRVPSAQHPSILVVVVLRSPRSAPAGVPLQCRVVVGGVVVLRVVLLLLQLVCVQL
jgi:hypothetical protein